MAVPAPSIARTHRPYSFRWPIVALEAFVALGAWSGVYQLWTGTFTPPVSDLEPLGLDSWKLPAVWLLVSVAIPSTIALVAALMRKPWTPIAVLAMASLLVVEVVVQIPFVGPSLLQLVMGGIAVVLAALAVLAGRRGDWAGTHSVG
jgi:hypothetical protein